MKSVMEHFDAAKPVPVTQSKIDEVVGQVPEPLKFSTVVARVPDNADLSPRKSYTDLELNLRMEFNPFNLPTIESVAYVIKGLFPEDDGLILRPLGERGIGIYKIQLTKSVDDLSELRARFFKESKDGKPSEQVLIPLTLQTPKGPRGNSDRRQGTLITIVNSATGAHRTLPNSLFDEVIQEHGEVVKPTELQKLRGTSLLNGNRYCVVDPTGKGTIPDSISVTNPVTKLTSQFYLRYKGQSWFYRRCDARHVGPCEALQKFYAAKEERAKEKITMKIASDSNLRCAEQVGLRSDIMCMPGAGLGHIANALKDDPTIGGMSQIMVVAGTNDVRNAAYENRHDFSYIIDNSIKKVKEAIPPESTLAFVHLASDLEDDTLNPDMKFKETYLSQELDRAQDERTQVITIHKGLIELDSTGHPTREGTASILQELAEFYPGLILNESFVTTERLYLGVQPLFRYGCVTCHNEGYFGNKLSCCEACLRKMESHDASEKLERVQQLLEEPLPGEANETVINQ